MEAPARRVRPSSLGTTSMNPGNLVTAFLSTQRALPCGLIRRSNSGGPDRQPRDPGSGRNFGLSTVPSYRPVCMSAADPVTLDRPEAWRALPLRSTGLPLDSQSNEGDRVRHRSIRDLWPPSPKPPATPLSGRGHRLLMSEVGRVRPRRRQGRFVRHRSGLRPFDDGRCGLRRDDARQPVWMARSTARRQLATLPLSGG
jgi:hypothetical protein